MKQSYPQATKRKLLSLQGRCIADDLRAATKVFDRPVELTADDVAKIHEELRDLAISYTEWKADALAFLDTCVAEAVK